MTKFLLIRHAVNDYVKTGRLAGWTPEVHLNEEGLAQAEAVGQRLAEASLAAIYSSPLERTMETAQAIAKHHAQLTIQSEAGIGEVRYGKWQGKKLRELSQHKKWYNVQHFPTRVQFPDGETMRAAQIRAVDTLERLYAAHPRGLVVVVSHSDIIKMIVAHFVGMHLDLFQRINIAPASLTVLSLGESMPMLDLLNDTNHLKSLQKKEDPKTEGKG